MDDGWRCPGGVEFRGNYPGFSGSVGYNLGRCFEVSFLGYILKGRMSCGFCCWLSCCLVALLHTSYISGFALIQRLASPENQDPTSVSIKMSSHASGGTR